MSGVSHTNTVLILSDLGLLSPSAHSWLCLKVPRQSWGRWAASGAPPNPGAAPPGVIPLSFPARIDFQAKHFQQDKEEGHREEFCVPVAVPAPGAELLPVPRCPVWDHAPCPGGILGRFGLFCGISAPITSAGACQGVALQRLMPAREKARSRAQGCRAAGTGPGWKHSRPGCIPRLS